MLVGLIPSHLVFWCLFGVALCPLSDDAFAQRLKPPQALQGHGQGRRPILDSSRCAASLLGPRSPGSSRSPTAEGQAEASSADFHLGGAGGIPSASLQDQR